MRQCAKNKSLNETLDNTKNEKSKIKIHTNQKFHLRIYFWRIGAILILAHFWRFLAHLLTFLAHFKSFWRILLD